MKGEPVPDGMHGFSENVPPNPSAMLESMRAYGYSLAAAVADLVDNSIAARASTVWIDTHWSGVDSWISVTDDGVGMTGLELRNAMRLGSQNPLDERASQDLGRFGLGLKTASFSQCRRLTVFTKTASTEQNVRRWDLDHLALPSTFGWDLLLDAHPDSKADLHRLGSLRSGTTVLWEVLDRIVQDAQVGDDAMRDHFLHAISDLESQLSMVFHRYLERGRDPLRIVLNDRALSSWNPFLLHHKATDVSPAEYISVVPFEEPVRVQGFVLPHKDKLSPEVHSELAGPKGWNAQQGFYLYRNERLIVAGSWLGLGGSRPWTQEEHYKLARIKLDIPNSMDHLWQLDVKKSSATPPPQLRSRLSGLAQTIRINARSVYAHRGAYGQRSRKTQISRVWKRGTRAGQVTYRIDLKHPVVAALLSKMDDSLLRQFKAMLRIVEESVPVEQIWIDAAETPEGHSPAFHSTPSVELRSYILEAYRLIRSHRKLSHHETIEVLGQMEEFTGEEAVALLTSVNMEGTDE